MRCSRRHAVTRSSLLHLAALLQLLLAAAAGVHSDSAAAAAQTPPVLGYAYTQAAAAGSSTTSTTTAAADAAVRPAAHTAALSLPAALLAGPLRAVVTALRHLATTAAAAQPAPNPAGHASSPTTADLLRPPQQQQQQQQEDTQQQQQQQRRRLQQQQQQQQAPAPQTPAQRAVANWYARQRRVQLLKAGLPISAPPPLHTSTSSFSSPASAAAAAAAAPGAADSGFVIPVPPPGAENPHEVQMPLYSPDQLRIRHKLIPDVPLESQIISLQEQLQQAEALKVILTPEQLGSANPLLGPLGPVKVPEKSDLSEFPDGYMAICAIVKNQHRDIREWLEYHRWIGVKKVYVYDNNSTAPLSTRIADMLHSGFVEYAFFTGQARYRDLFRTSSQWWAYNDCVQRFRYRHRWLAFIDADEFIVLRHPKYQPPSWDQQQQQQQPALGVVAPAAAASSTTGSGTASGTAKVRDINSFLQRYEPYGGLAINWVIFGSSGHASRPRGGVLVNYHACLPEQHEQNTHVKVIANTKFLLTVGDDPHRVYYKSSEHWTVNELGEKVTQARTPTPSHTKVALYHYLTKSESEYMQKMKRGSAAGNYKSPEFFHTINQFATDTCTAAIPRGLSCCPTVAEELGPQGVQQVKQRLAQLLSKQQQQQQQQQAAGVGGAAGGAPAV